MQCKDVPDLPILSYLYHMKGRWCNLYEDPKMKDYKSIFHAMPKGTPWKVAKAKMSRLIDRGLVEGCGCGCRGDFELSKKGWMMLRDAVFGETVLEQDPPEAT